MKIQFTKQAGNHDWMECIRDDGTSTRCPMPKQGILPHDFVHYVVEETLNLKRGFYGILAIGVGFPRSAPPWDAAEFEVGDLTEALQAESFVECFQAEMWNGFQASENFWEVLQITCTQRNVSAPNHMTSADLQQVRLRLQDHNEQWSALAVGETLTVEFET
jgi:5-methylcytosine-specific restriction endonuclease McrA